MYIHSKLPCDRFTVTKFPVTKLPTFVCTTHEETSGIESNILILFIETSECIKCITSLEILLSCSCMLVRLYAARSITGET